MSHFDSSRLSCVRSILSEAEKVAPLGVLAALEPLRRYCLTDFCELLSTLPSDDAPLISQILPQMPPPAEQAIWTNGSGHELLQDTIAFTRLLERRFLEQTGRALATARVLDVGCGFGRLMRSLLYFVEPDALAGVDPWPRSIATCKRFNVLGQLVRSDYVPTRFPLEDQFDLCFAYSVYTHLSERAARATLGAVREVIGPDGLFVITARPIEFWHDWGPRHGLSQQRIAALEDEHRRRGFAFFPVDTEVDGELVYGVTSLEAAWLEAAGGWRIEGYDRGFDYWQQIILLRPAPR